MQILLGKPTFISLQSYRTKAYKNFYFQVIVTLSIQLLLWRDKKKAAAVTEGRLSPSPAPSSDDPGASTSDIDERQTVPADKISPV